MMERKEEAMEEDPEGEGVLLEAEPLALKNEHLNPSKKTSFY